MFSCVCSRCSRCRRRLLHRRRLLPQLGDRYDEHTTHTHAHTLTHTHKHTHTHTNTPLLHAVCQASRERPRHSLLHIHLITSSHHHIIIASPPFAATYTSHHIITSSHHHIIIASPPSAATYSMEASAHINYKVTLCWYYSMEASAHI